MRLKTMFWAKGMRVISNEYREGYDNIKGFNFKPSWMRRDEMDKQAKEPATGRRR